MSDRQRRLHLEHIPDLDPGFRRMLEQHLLRADDVDLNLRWALAIRLELLEEVMCESLATVPDLPGSEETSTQPESPVEQWGWKAQDERLEELMREEVMVAELLRVSETQGPLLPVSPREDEDGHL